jgi:citrate synthase
LKLPRDAAFALFATARSVGLLAHCMEQLKVGKVIRPRGRYTGPALEEVNQSPSSGNGSKTLDPVTLDKNRVFKTIVR